MELGFPTSQHFSFSTQQRSNEASWIRSASCPQDSRSLMNCSWTTGKCPSNSAVKLKCREPGFLGCYVKPPVLRDYSPFQGLPKQNAETDMECVSICRGQGKDVAVIHKGTCVCVSSETLAAISSPQGPRYVQSWSCPSVPELQSRQDLYYAFNVSYGFCKHLGTVQYGQWDSSITWFGSTVTLTCDKDYVIKGNATLQCIGLPGQSTYFPDWNSSVPSCEAVDSNESKCRHPGNVPQGKWDSNTTLLGSFITLDCDDGYVLNGSATMLCVTSSDDGRTRSSLVWNASTPSCEAVERHESKCGHPGNVSHGKWDSNTTLNGSIVILHCDAGFILNGSATLLCITSSDDGLSAHSPYWNASIPSCRLVGGDKPKCSHPGNVSHGKWDLNTTRLGSVATLDCDEGYVISGNAKLLCVASSDESPSTDPPVWNASIPRCQAVEHTVPRLLIPLTTSIVIFITLLSLITTAWCLYRRKRYKPSSDPDQADNASTSFPRNRANNLAFPLYTLMPSVDHSIIAGGYPVPVGAEDSTLNDQDHVYQDADEVRRNVTRTQRTPERSVLVKGGDNRDSSTEQPPFTSEQSLGAECLLGTSHLMLSSGAEEYEYHTLPVNVAAGRGAAMKQVRLFDSTEYNSLESTTGPAIGLTVMRLDMNKRAEPASNIWNTPKTAEERSLHTPLKVRGDVTHEWRACCGESEYDEIGAANRADHKLKMPIVTKKKRNLLVFAVPVL